MSVQVSHVGWLGYVILTIVMGSLSFIILAAILGKPRKPKVTLLVITAVVGLFAAFVVGTWIGGLILSALMG